MDVQQRQLEQQFPCPQCLEQIQSPINGAEGLATNYCVQAMIEDGPIQTEAMTRTAPKAPQQPASSQTRSPRETTGLAVHTMAIPTPQVSLMFEERVELSHQGFETIFSRSVSSHNRTTYGTVTPSGMQVSLNNTVLLSRSDKCVTGARTGFTIYVAVQKFEGNSHMSAEKSFPHNPQHDTTKTNISPNSKYVSMTTKILKGCMSLSPFATMPSTVAALTNDRAWTYCFQQQEPELFSFELVAYTIEESPKLMNTIQTPFLFQGNKDKEHEWLQKIHTCCNPFTGELAVVHGNSLFLTNRSGKCTQ